MRRSAASGSRVRALGVIPTTMTLHGVEDDAARRPVVRGLGSCVDDRPGHARQPERPTLDHRLAGHGRAPDLHPGHRARPPWSWHQHPDRRAQARASHTVERGRSGAGEPRALTRDEQSRHQPLLLGRQAGLQGEDARQGPSASAGRCAT